MAVAGVARAPSFSLLWPPPPPHPAGPRFPSTLAPAKPMEQAAAPKVPCTRAIVSRTRPPSTRSSRLRRQRGSSDTTSQSRYLRAGEREVSAGGARPPGSGQGPAYLCLNRTIAASASAAGPANRMSAFWSAANGKLAWQPLRGGGGARM